MSYKKAITAFEALPEEEKYLIRNRYTRGGHHCAVGLLVQVPDLERRNAVGIWDLTNFNNETYFSKSVLDQIEELEMTREEAQNLQNFVDGLCGADEGRPLFDEALSFMRRKKSERAHVEDVLVGGCEP